MSTVGTIIVKANHLETLNLFNEKVTRLEESGLSQRLEDEPPEVLARWTDTQIVDKGEGRFDLVGTVRSEVADFDQDEIDAFVLTYRLFIQDNDGISIRSLNQIYEASWMPDEATECFKEARSAVNTYLDSPTTILAGSDEISRRHLADVIIYGCLAHNDRDKAETFKCWSEGGGLTGFLWAEFMATMKDMLHYLKYFRSLNQAVLDSVGQDE